MGKYGAFWLGSFGEDVVGELGGATNFEENLNRIDRLVATGDTYFGAVRCVLMTRGVVALLGFPGMDSSERMRAAAEALLQRAGPDGAMQTIPGRRLPKPDLSSLLPRRV